MPKQTLQERVVAYFLACGRQEVASRSRKYRQFTHPNSPKDFYFVGHNGAVRVGSCTTKTFSVTPSVMRAVKNWEIEQRMHIATQDVA